MFSRILFILTFVLLSGCSTTTVHIYGKYLTEAQQKEIVSIVKEQGLQAEVNELNFPTSVSHSSIVYSPMMNDTKSIEALIPSLEQSGWPIISSSALFTENHWFKKDTIGLFIVPDGVTPHSGTSMAEIANNYSGINCNQDLNLVLTSNGQYFFKDINNEQVPEEFASGEWKIRSFPYIEMKANKGYWWFYFTVKKSETTDVVGKINLTTLEPVNDYSVLRGCQFQLGIRN
jgi:uncharacterized protein YceK